jgi:hypothetical protein
MTLTYENTMVNYAASDIDVLGFLEGAETISRNHICSEMNQVLEAGVTLLLRYAGNEGTTIATIELDQQSCSQP